MNLKIASRKKVSVSTHNSQVSREQNEAVKQFSQTQQEMVRSMFAYQNVLELKLLLKKNDEVTFLHNWSVYYTAEWNRMPDSAKYPTK